MVRKHRGRHFLSLLLAFVVLASGLHASKAAEKEPAEAAKHDRHTSTDKEATGSSPILSPPSPHRILYVNPDGHLWSVRSDGSDPARIWSPHKKDNLKILDFDLVPDRHRVALLRAIEYPQTADDSCPPTAHPPWRIEVLDLRTSQTRLLLSSDGQKDYIRLRSPRWSPDGKTIAYIRNNDVWLLSPGESTRKRLTNLLISDDSPPDHGSRWDVGVENFAWSPKGDEMAVEVGRLSGSGIRWIGIVDVASRKVTDLTSRHGDGQAMPAWSPSGKCSWLFYWTDLIVFDPDMHEGMRFKMDSEDHDLIAWSLDGKYVACGGLEGPLCVFDPEQRKVVYSEPLEKTQKTPRESTNPVWLDDHILIYWKDGAVWSWEPAGNQARQIVASGYIPPFHPRIALD